ncbi:GntR family transcriptional regulator [Streptomyces sp. NPDC056672]|uniref:GntR family transcriptional regulator n=1 Tax=Streptomyces sp. NPDC056672 TaxID=3345906 RepID=UPI00368C26FC
MTFTLTLTFDSYGRLNRRESARLRAEGPAVAVELPGAIPAVALTDALMLRSLLHDPAVSTDPRRHWSLWPQAVSQPDRAWVLGWAGVTSLAGTTSSDHAPLRRIVSPALSLRLQKIQHHVPFLSRTLLSTLAARRGNEPADLRSSYALPHAMHVLCHLLGMPEALRTELEEPAGQLLDLSVTASEAAAILGRIEAVMHALVTHKRAHPGDDLTTDLLTGPADAAQLLRQVFGACLETTVHLITSCLHGLLTSLPGLHRSLTREYSWNAVTSRGLCWSPGASPSLLFAAESLRTEHVHVPAGTALLTSTAVDRTHPATSPLTTRWSAGDQLAQTVAAHALRVLVTQYPGIRLARGHAPGPARGPFQEGALHVYLPAPAPEDSAPVRFPDGGTRLTLEQQGRLARYAAAAHGNNASLQRIADTTGLSHETIRNVLALSGVRRPAGRPRLGSGRDGHAGAAVGRQPSWLPAVRDTAVADIERAVPLADWIAERIADGTYRPGTRLPAHGRLQARHRVALPVAQAAVALLVGRELVTVTGHNATWVRAGDVEPVGTCEHARARITEDIESGVLRPGERLPPRGELSRRYLTPVTEIDRALDALADAGLIEATPETTKDPAERVAALARACIADGTWPPGTVLPYATDRRTWQEKRDEVYAGMRILAQEGLVRTIKGTGTRVLPQPQPQQEPPPARTTTRYYYAVAVNDA